MEWVRYRRLPDRPVEAMHAHFERHSFDMHSHETYSFGLTEFGAQAFGCRGEARTSSAGLVMAFNPDEPHDGRAAGAQGFTYRIVHIGPELVADLLSDKAGRATGLPLFADPVLHDPVLAAALARLHASLGDEASALARDEALAATVAAMVHRGATAAPLESSATRLRHDGQATAADRARAVLDEAYLDDIGADELATAAGCSRFALYRAFRARYGLAPSDYQRLLRLRAARRLIGAGHPVAEAATRSGFADQAHLTRWFRRCYGLTPGAYQRAGRPDVGF
ncbi:MAG TPA: AraC family transcriptional regulator [Actinophytocola sp.]|uniref:AraC family transcriptional regulator n=1 Tax=Actinophytocola sp. TaxID=1872138 RepID=UPI002DBAB093|nr:AraC family transcriptional regulator [Actinophytocola sp.]HEU5471916.1 AraC family transcriptional regulator [Actinophytocola sp.]